MKKFENIVLTYKEGLEDFVKEVADDIIKNNNTNLFYTNHREADKYLLNNADLVITLGGDGTFVEAANLIEDIPILGINSSPTTSEGALASINVNEMNVLKDILNGNYKVIERQRARIWRNGELLPEFALNEVYVGAESQFHASRYVLKFNNIEEEQRSSGVVIATGTGSKAWYGSAGGKYFSSDEKELRFLVREPYKGGKIYVPKTLEGTILPGEKIIFESKRDFGGILAIGFKTYEFNNKDIVEVALADKPLKVIIK